MGNSQLNSKTADPKNVKKRIDRKNNMKQHIVIFSIVLSMAAKNFFFLLNLMFDDSKTEK